MAWNRCLSGIADGGWIEWPQSAKRKRYGVKGRRGNDFRIGETVGAKPNGVLPLKYLKQAVFRLNQPKMANVASGICSHPVAAIFLGGRWRKYFANPIRSHITPRTVRRLGEPRGLTGCKVRNHHMWRQRLDVGASGGSGPFQSHDSDPVAGPGAIAIIAAAATTMTPRISAKKAMNARR